MDPSWPARAARAPGGGTGGRRVLGVAGVRPPAWHHM